MRFRNMLNFHHPFSTKYAFKKVHARISWKVMLLSRYVGELDVSLSIHVPINQYRNITYFLCRFRYLSANTGNVSFRVDFQKVRLVYIQSSTDVYNYIDCKNKVKSIPVRVRDDYKGWKVKCFNIVVKG